MSPKHSINSEVLNLLKQVGLNQYESKIYTALLASGTSSAGDLSEFANVPRSRVYDVLTSLERKGFAIIQVGRPVKYVPVQIENAINQVKSAYEDDYNKKLSFAIKLEKDLKGTLGKYLDKRKKPEKELEDIIGVLKGKNNLYSHIKHLISTSQNRVVKMTNEYGLQNLEKHCKSALERAKKKNIDVKIITNVSGAKNSHGLHEIANMKTHKGIDGRFLVKDGQEAVLITGPEDTGFWIKSNYLAGYLEKLFEHAWEKGKDLSG